MRTNPLFPIIFSCVLFFGCNRTDPKLSFSAHSKVITPASATLVHSGGQYAGYDASYGFVFDVSDNKLQEHLIDEWQLKAAPVSSESGFLKFAKYGWWPTEDAFLKMDESYGRLDEQTEEYWYVWHDRPNGKLYVEHGRW